MGSDSNHQRRVVAEGKYVRLINDDSWEFAERVGGSGVVAILAVTDDGQVILTEQYRKAVDRRVIDLPAGLAGDIPGEEDEPLATAARRELEEETGYRADRMQSLFHGPSSAGLVSEIVTIFSASGLTQIGPGGGDDSEEIEVHPVPLENIEEWLCQKAATDVYIDPKVYVGLFFAERSSREKRKNDTR